MKDKHIDTLLTETENNGVDNHDTHQHLYDTSGIYDDTDHGFQVFILVIGVIIAILIGVFFS